MESNCGSRESRLASACAKCVPTKDDEAAIRHFLAGQVDWTVFAEILAERGLVSMAAHTLARIAPDMLPPEILVTFRTIIEKTRESNRQTLDRIASSPAAFETLREEFAVADRALADNPVNASAWQTLGHALSRRNRHRDAILCYDRAAALNPNDIAIWKDRIAAMYAIGRRAAALPFIDRALELDTQDAQMWTRRAFALADLQRFAESLEAGERALSLDPDRALALNAAAHAALFLCDWKRFAKLKERADRHLQSGGLAMTPFLHLAVSDSEKKNFEVARAWSRTVPPLGKPLWSGERYGHTRIRIAYVSTDFRDTLSVNAIAGCFEEHDKARFETTAVSLSPGDGSATRQRIEGAFQHFIDATRLDNRQISALLRDSEIDIAVDLNGYAGDKRTEIFAARPAPIQVNYLGYAGTMAMPFYDYIIADRVVIPERNRPYYSEQVVYLPNSFFPLDRRREIAETTPGRTEAGLPQSGFVFACHNSAYKIRPDIFEIWMRLLRENDGSVLWLGSTLPEAGRNLQQEAGNRGVAPERLVFAPKVRLRKDHLARLRLADLILDTLPYNAHTTATDALWAGVPLLTCIGETFPSRVAASLLIAAGLPELITATLGEYEESARDLARNPGKLADLRARLRSGHATAPLFDTVRFTRDLEAAYFTMWQHRQTGLPPRAFCVTNQASS